MDTERAVGRAVLATPLLVFLIVQLVFWAGVLSPIVKANCADDTGGVTSNWKVHIWILPSADSAKCVRNSPTRELLATLRIWKLKSPEQQYLDHLEGSPTPLAPRDY